MAAASSSRNMCKIKLPDTKKSVDIFVVNFNKRINSALNINSLNKRIDILSTFLTKELFNIHRCLNINNERKKTALSRQIRKFNEVIAETISKGDKTSYRIQSRIKLMTEKLESFNKELKEILYPIEQITDLIKLIQLYGNKLIEMYSSTDHSDKREIIPHISLYSYDDIFNTDKYSINIGGKTRKNKKTRRKVKRRKSKTRRR